MKEVKMFEAVIITGTGVEILRVSNSKKQLDEFVEDYIYRFYESRALEILRGEDSYTILYNNNDFVSAIKIRRVACIIAGPEEIADEEIETEKTAKNVE